MGRKFYCFIMLLIPVLACAQGTVVDDSFYSNALESEMMVDVYLPEGYDQEDPEARYPVIYFLHGGGSNQNGYPEINTAMNNLIGISIEPAILVKPDGGIANWWSDSPMTGNYETYVAQDLVAYIDSEYNTIAERSKRAIMGHSLGGYGTMTIALRYPDTFCAAASHGGAVNMFCTFDGTFSVMINENGGSGPYDPSAGWASGYVYDCAAVFSPNPDNPPYNVDLPIDNDGSYVDSTWARWLEDDPATIAVNVDPSDSPALYMDAGRSDFSHACTNAFADSLDALNFEFRYLDYDGGHMNQLPQRYPISLAFIDSVMNQEIARAYNVTVSPGYAAPGSGEVQIQAQVLNTLDHDLYVSALVRSSIGDVDEAIELFDDGTHGDEQAGDGFYTNDYQVGPNERFYAVSILVSDLTVNQDHQRTDVARFTSAGPLVFHDLTDTSGEPVPGERFCFKLVLQNQGEEIDISELYALLTVDTSLVTIASMPHPRFGTIPAGETGDHSGLVRMDISPDCPIGTPLLVDISIECAGNTYWLDQFTIMVTESGIKDGPGGTPVKFNLSPVFPNPFNSTTTIRYSLEKPARTKLTLFNIYGQEVYSNSLGFQDIGYKSVALDASGIASGVYLLQLNSGSFSASQKVVLVR